MAHPDSDGAAEMLEGGHRALSTAAMRLAELYAQRVHIQARLREQQARSAAELDQRHTTLVTTAAQTLNTAAGQSPPEPLTGSTDREQTRAAAIRDVTPEEFTHARAQAEQERNGTGSGVAAADEDAVTRRQFEILESEAFIRAVLDDREQWEARQIATTPPGRGPHRSGELDAAEVWLAQTAPAEFAVYQATQVGPGRDSDHAETAQENLVNRYESSSTPQQRPTPTAPGHDSAAARETRAAQLDRGGLDQDIIQGVMITDLGFGTAAAESVAATAAKRRPAAKARNRGEEREHHALGR
jgi:hypothetical protein